MEQSIPNAHYNQKLHFSHFGTPWPMAFTAKRFPLNEPLHTLRWETEEVRPTVVVLLYTSTGKVCLVRSSKTGKGGPHQPYGLLQGGIKSIETVMDAVFREGEHEIGLTRDNAKRFGHALGFCLNRLPPERHEPDKLLLFVAIEVYNPQRLHVRRRVELSGLQWVASGEEARSFLTQTRPPKRRSIFEAFAAAHAQGLVPWEI